MTHAGLRLEALMTEYRGIRQIWRRQWLLLGLMLVLLMLGHDALMASEALTAPRDMGVIAQHVPIDSGHEDGRPAHHDSMPLPQHPEQCGVSIVALIRTSDTTLGFAYGAVLDVLVTVADAPAHRWNQIAAAWEEPHWPPCMLRALTQVYRI